MAEWAPAQWRKLWGSFVDSRKLRRVGSDVRAVLATAIATAWWDGESEEGRIYRSAGKPTTVAELLDDAEVPRARQQAAWSGTLATGVLAIVEVGPFALITIPRFRKAQEGRSTKYTRRHREASGNGSGSNAEGQKQKEEAEGEGEGELTPTPSGPGLALTAASPSKRKAKPRPAADERIERILAAIDAERARRTPPLPPLTATQRNATTIASALGRGATVERLLEVVGAFGKLCDRDPSKASVLNATTMFTGPSSTRPGGLAWGESLLDEERAPRPTFANTNRRGPAPPSPRPTVGGVYDMDGNIVPMTDDNGNPLPENVW